MGRYWRLAGGGGLLLLLLLLDSEAEAGERAIFGMMF